MVIFQAMASGLSRVETRGDADGVRITRRATWRRGASVGVALVLGAVVVLLAPLARAMRRRRR